MAKPVGVMLETEADSNVVAAWVSLPEVQFIHMHVLGDDLPRVIPLAHTMPNAFKDAWRFQTGGARCDGAGLDIWMKPGVALTIPTFVELGAAKCIHIWMYHVDVTGHVAVALVEAVRTAQKLKVNFLGSELWAPDFFDNVADAASVNMKLQRFWVAFHHVPSSIADTTATRLASVFGNHVALQDFAFEGDMSDGACVALVESLCETPCLREIKLASNHLGNGTAEAVAQKLHKNYSLLDIRIEYPPHPSQRAIARAVSVNCDTVETRNLSLWNQRMALQALARFNGYGFATLASVCFRNKLLEYFLPAHFAFRNSLCIGAEEVNAREGNEAPDQNLGEVLDPPSEFVADHDELPAVIGPAEAEWLQEEQRNSFIEHRLASGETLNSPNTSNRKTVVLSFSRLSQELEAALLDSSPAEVARAHGVDVLPGWAGGAKVFVHNICADDLNPSLLDMLKCSGVLMYEDDIGDLLRELKEDKHLPFKVRKFKTLEGLPSVPEELSLMNISSHEFAQSDEASISSSDSSEVVVTVRHMFLEISAGSSCRSVLSANI